jgi:tRNA nucleotidyltransferase/poly(A) polymerase
LNRETLERLLTHRVARDALLRAVRDLARELPAGIWLCGGYVRDVALGRPPVDLDLLATTGVRPAVGGLRSLCGRRGFRFRKRGVTTWRFDLDGRKLDLVDASRRGLEADLTRRELTINAMAYSLREPRLADPLRGLADLRAGRLRAPRAGAFRDDPARAVRLARFLAELPAFRATPATLRQARDEPRSLARLPVERLTPELDRLLDAPAPARGLHALAALALLAPLLPELMPMLGCRAGLERPDVWTHTLDAIELSAAARRRLPGATETRRSNAVRIMRWALLLHDISKPETFAASDDRRPSFHGHEVLGARRADALLKRLRMPREDRRRIRALVLHHLRPGHLADAGAPARGLRRLVREAGPDLPLLVFHAACDARASGSPDHRARWRRLLPVLHRLLELHSERDRQPLPALVNGRDVLRAGIPAGPRIGRLLDRIRELQEEGTLTTRRQALAWIADQLDPTTRISESTST